MQAYVWILVLVRHHQPSLLRSRQLGSPSLDQNVVMVVALKQVPRFGHVWGRTLFVPEPGPSIKKICIVVPVQGSERRDFFRKPPAFHRLLFMPPFAGDIGARAGSLHA